MIRIEQQTRAFRAPGLHQIYPWSQQQRGQDTKQINTYTLLPTRHSPASFGTPRSPRESRGWWEPPSPRARPRPCCPGCRPPRGPECRVELAFCRPSRPFTAGRREMSYFVVVVVVSACWIDKHKLPSMLNFTPHTATNTRSNSLRLTPLATLSMPIQRENSAAMRTKPTST